MASSNTSYDPIVSVEGMYKGSLTRLGYFFKDPKLYGGATLAVLRETAKRYDDTLDDCLIQILDAKWLLEHQLVHNRARRAQEAAETEVAFNKRKLENAAGSGTHNVEAHKPEENSAKRIKVQSSPQETPLPLDLVNVDPSKEARRPEPAQDADERASDTHHQGLSKAEEIAQKGSRPGDNETSKAVHIQNEKSNVNEAHKQDTLTSARAGETNEQKEQPEQTANEEELNFESMFSDANDGNEQNNDLQFNLELNTDNLGSSNPFGSTTHDGNHLGLLPGLESYANSSGDDFTVINIPTSVSGAQSGNRVMNDDFGLPEIQSDNNFNDLFADGDFGGDASLMDLDLEDGFFKTG